MNKLYLITLGLLFLPADNIIEFKKQSYNILLVLIFIFFTYYFKYILFKIDLRNIKNVSLFDKIKDLAPIFSIILLGICVFLSLSYIENVFGKPSVVISICYITSTIITGLLFKQKKFFLYMISLLTEYFLVSLICFQFNNTVFLKEIISLYFSFSCFLASLKVLDQVITSKIPKDYSVKLLKSKLLPISTSIFLLSSIYPMIVGLLATSLFHNKNLILFPIIIFINLIALKRVFSVDSLRRIKALRALILILPILVISLMYF